MTKFTDRLLIGLNVAAAALLIFIALRPGGPVREMFDTWRAHREMRKALAAAWPQLSRSDRRLSADAAPIRLVEVSDYQCPFCRRARFALDSLIASSPQMGVALIHFPLPEHPAAPGAARASLCAETQGKFREMDHRLMETSTWMADTDWVREARAVGIPDIHAFVRCLQSPETAQRLAADAAIAAQLRVDGTPTFVTSESSASGVQSLAQLKALVGQPH